MNELLLSDDEIDLIWHLPYITEKDRLRAIVQAQLDNVLEVLFSRRGVCEADRQLMPTAVVAGS